MKHTDYHGRATLRRIETAQRVLDGITPDGSHLPAAAMATLVRFNDHLRTRILPHMASEERCVFPFLEMHVPKLQPVIALLLAEHGDFRGSLKRFDRLLKLTGRARRPAGPLAARIRLHGLHLVLLLRSHIWAEAETIDRAISRTLRPSERKLLDRCLLTPTARIRRSCYAA